MSSRTKSLTFIVICTLLRVHQLTAQGLAPYEEGSADAQSSGNSSMFPSSGSGSEIQQPDLTCSAGQNRSLTVAILSSLESLFQRFQCTSNSNVPLLYMLTFPDSREGTFHERQALNLTILDVFNTAGDTSVSVRVCREGASEMCDQSSRIEDLGSITVSVNPLSSERLFPYGDLMDDQSFRGVLDGARVIYPSESIPFFSNYYRRLYVSSNGLVSLGQQYLSWWPVPFPYGRSRVPIIAPFWADFDFRNNIPSSRIYYHVYERGRNPSLSDLLILDEFQTRLGAYNVTFDPNFQAEWMAVITWNDAVPYYWSYNTNERATFQLVLVSDFVQTHALYLYQDSTLPSWQHTVIGYDTRDFVNYNNVEFNSQAEFLQVHNMVGNTGRPGEWFFDLTSQEDRGNPEQRCTLWARRQQGLTQNINPHSLRINACPCTRRQAQRDWNFWFAYFWGLSSAPNCATVLFSQSQGTIECCYDNSGALIVGPRHGGSFKMYNPLFFYQQNFLEDLTPYQDCCVMSNRCRTYYMYRPPDNCSRYVPPVTQFTFGDPHFRTVDSANFTFNGIGEYVLIHSPSVKVQARLQKFSSNVTGTVISAIAVKQGDVHTIQVQNENEEIAVYIGGVKHEINVGESPLVVTSSGVISNDLSGGISIEDVGAGGDAMNMANMENQVFVRRDSEDGLVISTGGGASVSISLQTNFLAIVVELSETFEDMTSGLLGVFNGNPNDDFRNRDGDILNLSTEEEIYHQFGLAWHLLQNESIFNYSIGSTSYSEVNEGFMTYLPVFTEDLIDSVPQEVIDSCQSNLDCVYDATVTGNIEVGISTYNISLTNDDITQTLQNTPPSLSGEFLLFATSDTPLESTYMASDADPGDTIDTLALKEPIPDGFEYMTMNGNTLVVMWSSPNITLPTSSLVLFANDSNGAPSIRSISIVLCACANGGSCIINEDNLGSAEFNHNNHYKWPCDCPEFFGGDSCEVDMKGCGEFSVCPDYSVCANNSMVPSGYTCNNCSEGYELVESGGKCTDIDECMTMAQNCEHNCNNTEGNYTCSCNEGYRLGGDQRSCKDINECEEGSSGCSQRCINTDGGFTCECESGYNRDPDDMTICIIASCGTGADCGDEFMCAMVGSSLECLCPPGMECIGTCSVTDQDDLLGTRKCQTCPNGMYGLRCAQTCGCGDNGRCDSVTGCVCEPGWMGVNCTIEINNNTPVFPDTTPSMIQVYWNQTMGTEVLRVMASDEDVGPNARAVRYGLTTSRYPLPQEISDGRTVFSINERSGEITLQSDLISLAGMFSGFVLTITAEDRGMPPMSTQHVLTIEPIPVPNFQPHRRMIPIDEESPLGTSISTLMCNETGPPSGSIELTLSGVGSENFRIDRASSLVVFRRLDYESLQEEERSFNLVAYCRNHFNLSDNIMIRVTVRNIDDNPFLFNLPHYSVTVQENSPPGTHVTTVSASDRDLPEVSITYSFRSTGETRDFRILPNNGTILLESSPDREERAQYSLSVEAVYLVSNGVQVRTTTLVTVTIADVNDEHPRFDPPFYIVRNITTMNEVGESVITVTAIDSDVGVNGEVSYLLEGDSQEFVINSTTGEVSIAASLFPELYSLTVNATDDGQEPLSSTTSILIYVLPSLSHIELMFRDDPIVLSENTPVGYQIGQAVADVIDNSNTTLSNRSDLILTYEIVNGTDRDRFLISRTMGGIFLLGILDYDALAREYDLIISATLVGLQLTDEAVLRIMITNVDDNPPFFSPSFYAISVEEFTLPNTLILTVSATDPDGLETIEYSLSGPDSTPFSINNSTGSIFAAVELETAQDYRFFAVASDGGTQISSAVVYISVTRSESVAPSFTKTEFLFDLSESATPGTFIGMVTAVTRGNRSSTEFSHLGFRIIFPDPISFNNMSLIPTNTSQDLFHIDPRSGNISTQSFFEFDSESRQIFVFYVEIFNVDDGTGYENTTVQVRLQDENDNSPIFDQSLYTRVINTSLARNSIVAVLNASDRDSGSNSRITYEIERQDLLKGFVIGQRTGEISTSNSTLIPGDYYLDVIGTDGGNPPRSSQARIYIAVIPITPEDIEFTREIYHFTTVEDAPPNTLLGAIRAVQINSSLSSSDITYSVINVTNCFSIDSQSGEIRLSCTILDRDTIERYEFPVKAEVNGDVEVYGTVRVTLEDINDNAPDFSLDVYTSVIDDRHGNSTPILQVVAVDADQGINGTVSYEIVPQDNNIFRVNSTSGEVFLINNTVQIGDYRLSVQATDMGIPERLSSSALVLICITRAHPQTLQFATRDFNITENSPPGTEVGIVTLATNGGNIINTGNFPNNLQFSITGGDSPDLFEIDRNTGRITTSSRNINREESTFHIIRVLANFTQFNDIQIQHVESDIRVAVLDVNDNAPAFQLRIYSTVIDDNRVLDKVIFNITASDTDSLSNAELSFSINPQPASFFGVRVTNADPPNTYGEIFVNDTLTPGNYRFTLTASDRGTPPLSSNVTVDIIVEHAIPEMINFTSSNYSFFLNEETPDRTVVGTVSVLPETPALDPLIFAIEGGDGEEYFIIDASSGVIMKNHRRIDRENITVLSLMVRAYLPEQNPPLEASTVVTVTIQDINDNRPRFTEAVYPSIGVDTDMIQANHSLVTVMATDDDIGSNAEVDFAIHSIMFMGSSYGGHIFTINQDGQLFLSPTLETGTYIISISGSDRGNPGRTSFTSVVVQIQRPAPDSITFTNPSGYSFTLTENNSSVTFARVALASIPNYLRQFIRYSGTSANFSVSDMSGNITALGTFDYEMVKNFSFTVTAMLNDSTRLPPLNLEATVNVTILIIDVNDNTPFFLNFPSEITQYENRTTREVVYDLNANDSDSSSNSQLVYEIQNTDIDWLIRINSANGELTTSASLDRENSMQARTHMIVIRVCDMGTPRRCVHNSTPFRLLDINDNRPRLISGVSYNVAERRPPGSRVFSFQGMDPDSGANGTIRYFITSSNVPFLCDSVTGQVTLTEELDYEMRTFYIIIVQLNDTGTPQLTTHYNNVRINVVNKPDNTPEFVHNVGETMYRNNTDPTVLRGDVLFQVMARDADIPSSNDSLRYEILSVVAVGNNNTVPQLMMEATTGRIVSSVNQVFIPEATFTLSVLVYDQSEFNLTDMTTLLITVIPDPLAFTQTQYTVSVREDSGPRDLITLPIRPLSVSSNITYSIEIVRPTLPMARFSESGNGFHNTTIRYVSGLDREVQDEYVIRVTATRSVRDRTQTTLLVRVIDANDNNPVIIDRVGTISISENVPSQTVITRVNATDRDIGDNALLVYRLSENGLPFSMNSSTGVIRAVGNLDYETTPSYNITVTVRDSGSPPRVVSRVYTINVENLNDNFPEFSALAYFGEVYARATINEFIRHTEVRVTDRDDVRNQQILSFRIYSETRSDFRFRVDPRPPYLIRVEAIPDEADASSQLLELRLEVTDEGGKAATVPLYISVFTSNNIASYVFHGVSVGQLLSCETPSTSICNFLRAIGSLTRMALQASDTVTFYNYTVNESPSNPNRIMVEVFGWYGSSDYRENRGELNSPNRIQPINYVPYNEELFQGVAEDNSLAFFGFAIELEEKVTTPPPTTMIVTAAVPLTTIIGVAVAVVIVALVVILVIVLVCVFGRKRDQPKKKKNRRPSDPYDRSINRLRNLNRSKKGSFDETPLHSTGQSDLAYETMYDDDEIVDTAQTMPWFDPKYLASGKDDYDGDTEHTLDRPAGNRQGVPFNLRATVDGDARRGRRHSSDESAVGGQSVTELDHSDYLQGYQSSTPMQPGQRMGEFDMFASPRDPDKPFRPSLEHAQNEWEQHQKQLQSQRSQQQSQQRVTTNQPNQRPPVNQQQMPNQRVASQQLPGQRLQQQNQRVANGNQQQRMPNLRSANQQRMPNQRIANLRAKYGQNQ